MYPSASDGLTQNVDLGGEDRASDRSSSSDTSSDVGGSLRRSDRIAKDTGCCLYSAISALVTMLAILGIVLILTGPTKGLSLLPSLKSLSSAQQYNQLGTADNGSHVLHNWTSTDYPEGRDSGGSESEILPSETDYDEFYSYDYQGDNATVWSNGSTPTISWTNGTVDRNTTAEDLDQLQPEAFVGGRSRGYVAYIPVPIDSDDEDSDEDDDEGDEDERPSRRRPIHRRPAARKPMVLPMMVLPSSAVRPHSDYERTRTRADFYDQADYVAGNRRFDEFQPSDSDSEHLVTVRPRIPAAVPRPPLRNFSPRPVGNIDYRMFGTLAYENRNKDGRYRDDPRMRVSERRPESSRQRPLVIRPSGYRPGRPNRRPAPYPHEREYREQRFSGQRIRTPAYNPHPPAVYVRQTVAPSSRKPADYQYPPDAMNIQDIIGYMTSVGHGDHYHESANSASRNYYNQHRNSVQYRGNNHRPTTSNANNYRGFDSATASTRNKPPYSFMLDVYPMKERNQPGNAGSYRNEDRRQYSDNRHDAYDSYASDYRTYAFNSKNVHRPAHDDDDEVDEEDLPLVPNKGIIAKTPYGDPPAPPPNKKQHKVVVHLNVYNQKNGETRVEAEDRSDHDEYFSPSDIYRAVLRNNAAKRDQSSHVRDGHSDDSLPGGESRVFVTHKISSEIGDDSADDVQLSYKNHKMSEVDEYRTPAASSRPRYRTTYVQDDEIESLPVPMAQQQLNASRSDAPVETRNQTAGTFQRLFG